MHSSLSNRAGVADALRYRLSRTAFGRSCLVAASLILCVTPAQADPISGAILFGTIFGADIFAAGAATVFVVGALTSVAVYGVVGVALAAASTLLGKALNKPGASSGNTGGSALAGDVAALRVAGSSAVISRQMVVGRVLKSGTMFFQDVKGAASQYLYRGVILAAHEIDGADAFYVDTKKVRTDINGFATEPPFFTGSTIYCQFSLRTGAAGQLSDRILSGDFRTLEGAFRQQGLACLVIKAYRGVDGTTANNVWGSTGAPPNPLALIRGKKFFDPRDPTQIQGVPSTYKWSRNGAVVFFGWLTDTDGGNISWNDVDMTYFRTAADECDRMMPKKDGTFEPAYCLDGVIDTGQDPDSILSSLLSCMNAELTQVSGKYAIVVGARHDSVRTLSDKSARGTLDATCIAPWNDTINTVRTSFVAADRDYQVATGPVYQSASALAEDGTEKSVTLELPFVTSVTQVQRIAKTVIARSRLGKRLVRGEDVEAIRHVPTDIIYADYQGALSSLSGTYEIIRITDSDRLDEFLVECVQYDANKLYGWNPAVDQIDWSPAPAASGA